MKHQYTLHHISALTLGFVLASGIPAHAYEDYPNNSGTGSYDRSSSRYDNPSGNAQSTQSRDRYDTYGSQQSPYSTPSQGSAGSGVPFGLSKSTAGAIVGAILGAGSGAIIGSHRGKAGPGALIGGGLGAVGGYVVGHQIEGQDQALDEQEQRIAQQRQEIAHNRALLEELKRRHLDARETDRGVVVNLPDVLFEFNKASLTPEAQTKVSHIAQALEKQAGNRRVSVEGHADAIGSDSYNLTLSQRRAEVVGKELAYDGVRNDRLTTHGYGEKYPVAPNTNQDGSDNPAGRAKNRRVEVVIEN